MCFGDPIEPPTEKSANFVLVLKIITFIQLVISILNLVTVFFVREGVLGLIMIILLFNAFRRLSYQSLISYTFIAMFFFITFLVYVMTE